MDLNEELSRYPNIAEKAKQMGKIKEGFFNKKRYAEAVELWQRFSEEELEQLNQEIANAEILLKTTVVTPTALCYFSVNVFFVIPVRDIVWAYTRIIKESMNFIPTGKRHQIFLMERSGEQHLICEKSTGPFTKKTPAGEALGEIKRILDPVRPGIVYGYSDEIYSWFCSDLRGAVAQIDAESTAK